MTLFVTTPKRKLAINDGYLITLDFLINFIVTRVTTQVIKKLIYKYRNSKEVKIINSLGETINIDIYFLNDNKLDRII